MPRSRSSRVLCRVETDAVAAFRFLQLNGYPHFWSPDRLTDGVILVRVMDLQCHTIGYLWGQWVEPGRLGFHACVRRGLSFPFLGSDLLEQMFQFAFWLGADELVTNVTRHPDYAPLRRLLLRLGFVELPRTDGGSDFSLDLWTLNERRTRKEEEDDWLSEQQQG